MEKYDAILIGGGVGSQRGYGVQTAPAMVRLGAALIRGAEPPTDLVERSIEPARLAPGRLART